MTDTTTIAIYREDTDYIKELQYNIWKQTKQSLSSPKLMKLILEFIKDNEVEFLEYVKNKLSSQG